MSEPILIVDDEEAVREMLALLLSDSGFRVFTAENGKQALQIIGDYRPQIVICDLKMPGMNGIELLRRIKTEAPDTEIITMSGHGDMELAVQSLIFEAADFITKPVNGEALEIALERVHEKIRTRAALKEYTRNLERLVKEKSERLLETEKLATQRYQQLAQKFEQLFDEVPCYISVHDTDYRLTAVNRRFKEDFGDCTGSRCFEAYKNLREPCIECPVMKTFKDGQPHYSEEILISKSFEQLNVLTWTTPIRDPDGEITQVMSMSHDVTKVRKLQNHLSSLGLLIGTISHAVKGLLTGLDGGMYMVNSGFTKADRQLVSEGWDTVTLVVGRLRKLIIDILYYAKERELEWEEAPVLRFSEEVASTIEFKLAAQKIEFVRDFDQSSGTLELDLSLVHSALMNIFENAIETCIEDKSKTDHRIIFQVEGDQDSVFFHVRDNGVGMDTETKQKLFTMFFSSKGQKGTGLGLFVSNQVIRQHGGTINVQSEPGEGSCFTIRLPRSRR